MVDPQATEHPLDGSPPEPRPSRDSGVVALVDTVSLFAGGTEVRLLHRGQEYRLRITRQGKLILTK